MEGLCWQKAVLLSRSPLSSDSHRTFAISAYFYYALYLIFFFKKCLFLFYWFYKYVFYFLFCPWTVFRVEKVVGWSWHVVCAGRKLYLVGTLFDTGFDFPNNFLKHNSKQPENTGKTVNTT